jgi:hypothetical protein
MIEITYSNRVERALVALLGRTPDGSVLYQQVGDDALWQMARKNHVAPLVAHALTGAFGPGQVAARWRQVHEENYRRISAYLDELDRVAARLAQKDIPIIALKNGGIARGIYPCPGCCPMGDLDVLVERRHFRQAHQMLLAAGYHFEFRSPLEEAALEAAEQSGGAEYWKTLPNGEKLWFELQWRPVAGRWIRPDQEPTAEELMARSLPIPGTAVRFLSPEDNLLQVALHAAKHSYVRAPGFRLHLDVERIVRAYLDLDWDLFVEQVSDLQVKTAVYFSLAIPQALFQTPIPERVLQTLRPPRWKERLITRWLNRAGLFDPDERKFSRPGYILFSALLYDDFRGLLRGLFPDRTWMRQRYGFRNDLLLPYYHARRLFDLVFRRMNT